eukprot:ANDGO_05216.mRNA.1 hypothetical protein
MERGDERVALESEIAQLIFKDNRCTSHFAYSDTKPETVRVITYNPHHGGASFLVGVFTTLTAALDYVRQSIRKDELSYSVTWAKRGNPEPHVSYFYGTSLKEVVDKFYFDKDPLDFIVRSVTLNPSS